MSGQYDGNTIYYRHQYITTKRAKRANYMLTSEKMNDSISTRVFYLTKTGQKLWTETYLNGQPYGIWERFDKNGNLTRKINYNFLVPYGSYDRKEMSSSLPEKPEENVLSTKNQEIIQKHIVKEFLYPETAKAESIQGRVVVLFTINKEGEVENVRILKGSHIILDTEAFRIVKSIPNLEPVIHDGMKIKSDWNVPIIFRIQ